MRITVRERLDWGEFWIYASHDIDDPHGRRIFFVADGEGGLDRREVPYGEEPPPLLRLDAETYDALRAAMAPSSGDADALRDAREMRDRLLSMVGAEWSRWQRSEP